MCANAMLVDAVAVAEWQWRVWARPGPTCRPGS